MNFLCLASDQVTRYHIVTAKTADETVRLAADELHRYLYRCTGTCFPVFSDQCPCRGPEIRVGTGVREAPFYQQENLSKLGNEGFVVATEGEDLYITGATSRGTLYGVMGFLERFCSIRFLTSQVTWIPHMDRLEVSLRRWQDAPAFEYRDVYWTDAFQGEFCYHNRLNGSKADLSSVQGGKLKFFNFHHSFNDLIPKEEYYQSHPQYFSQVDGKRLGENTQLCLSNPQVFQLCLEKLRSWIADNPDCTVFSVAQNDCGNPCQCPSCQGLDRKEGCHSASIIHFVNRLAETIEKEYPRVFLHTFAYQYSMEPPRSIRPRANVIVRLCDIDASFSAPLLEEAQRPDSYERLFCESLAKWSSITPRLYIWDYVTNFRHYLLPFPNLDAIQGNLQYFHQMGVKGVLEQGNFSHGGGGAMAELEAYLLSKLLWNPEVDLEREKQIFLNGYFEKAASAIGQYLDLLQRAVRGYRLSIYDGPDALYFSDNLVQEGVALFDEAERSVTGEVLRRVKKARLSLQYLQLSRLPLHVSGRDKLVEDFGKSVRGFYISELSERVALEVSLKHLKESRYAASQDGNYSLYYRM